MAARSKVKTAVRGGLRGLGVLLGAVLAALVVYAWMAAPKTRGEVEITGLDAPAEIWRDRNYLVTIRADGEADAYRALGYLHAQERLWQMDMSRRGGAGRLSEVVGEATLEIDRLLRALQLYHEAERQLTRLSPELVGLLEAYASGVNAYIDSTTVLTPEFLALGYRPEPWAPADSIVWGNLMAVQLSGDWREELVRLRLAQRLSPEQVDFFWPRDPEDAPVTLPRSAWPRGKEEAPPEREAGLAPAALPDNALAALTNILPWPLAPKSASNWWVVDGEKSVTGKPILANDPHLGLSAPGTWMLVRLEWPGADGGTEVRAGVTAPGVPFHIIGHNGHLAWGFTTTHSDTQDLFVEQLSSDGTQVETAEGWVDLIKRRETIRVRGGEEETITLLRTPRGPVISSALDEEERALFPPDTALSLSWPLYDPDNRSPEGFFRMNRAKTPEAFLAALSLIHAPQQNVAFADTAGNIGFALMGAMPQRPLDDGSKPLAAWVKPFAWEDRVPFGLMPQALNPPEGLLVNANNRPVPDSYPYLINRSFPDPGRAQRIEEMLAGHLPLGPSEAAAMQLDALSVTARDLLPLILPALTEEQRLSPPAQALAGWNHVMTRHRAEPTLFAAWARALQKRLFEDETEEVFEEVARPDRRLIVRALTEQRIWCDDVSSRQTVETCEQQVRLAYADALALLEERLGPDWESWTWGRLHRAPFDHPAYRFVPVLGDLLAPDLATPGWDDTVNRGGTSLGYERPEALFRHRHGAGLRVVYDLADLDNSLFMIAPGQSGNIFSSGYANLALKWRDGRTLKLVGPATDEDRLLRLTPAE